MKPKISLVRTVYSLLTYHNMWDKVACIFVCSCNNGIPFMETAYSLRTLRNRSVIALNISALDSND
jgi:hypothetical protein